MGLLGLASGSEEATDVFEFEAFEALVVSGVAQLLPSYSVQRNRQV